MQPLRASQRAQPSHPPFAMRLPRHERGGKVLRHLDCRRHQTIGFRFVVRVAVLRLGAVAGGQLQHCVAWRRIKPRFAICTRAGVYSR